MTVSADDAARIFNASCAMAAVLNFTIQKFRRSVRWLDLRTLLPEMFNGAAMPPFLLLIFGSLGWSSLLALLEKVNPPTLFLAGMVGLLALLDMSFGAATSPFGSRT